MKILKSMFGCAVVLMAMGVRAQLFTMDSGETNTYSQDFYIGSTNIHMGIATNGNMIRVNNGATFTAGDIVVGLNSSENRLEAVAAKIDVGSIVLGAFADSDGNSATVSAGQFNIDGNLVVGNEGTGNRLDVIHRGAVKSKEAWVGFQLGATSNVVRVADADSVWINTGALTIGTNGNSGNFVTVTNGGHISVGSLDIRGTGNGFDLDWGGRLTVSNDFIASQDGFSFNGGSSLYVGGVLTGMTNALEDARTLGIAGTWNQTGFDVLVGGASTGSTLNVEGGGAVTADNLLIGTGSNTVGNAVSVRGSGSTLTLTGTVEIGSATSSNNTVDIYSKGKLTLGSGPVINSNNTLTVRNNGHLVVNDDFDASMDGFVFGKGGIVETTGTFNWTSNSVEGARSIRLTGGTWNMAGDLTVGDISSGNSIDIRSGGALTNGAATLGASVGANGIKCSLRESDLLG